MRIYCMGCETNALARLTNGAERYPHRPDLADIPFWTHDECGTWVGCHHKTSNPTRPLGILATPEMFKLRQVIHTLIDPIWQNGHMKRGQIYAHITREIGYQYHTGELRSIEEGKRVCEIVEKLYGKIIKEL